MAEIIDLAGLTLRSRNPVTKHVAILLHGYGSDAADMNNVAPSFAQHLPDTAFVSVDAPFPGESGFGRQWFSLRSWDPGALADGIRSALPSLQACIDAQASRFGLSRGDVALIGFSQGTMMALAAGLGQAPAVAGVLGYSGAWIATGEVAARPPVLLVHGDSDDVVPHAASQGAATTLKADGVPIDSIIRPGLGHSIDSGGLLAGIDFLRGIWR